MKTSILISTFAAFCLLITFAESPSRRFADKRNGIAVDGISCSQVNYTGSSLANAISGYEDNATGLSSNLYKTADFSYLKFNALYFIEAENAGSIETEVLPEAVTFDYLKFNAGMYTNETVGTELPEAENNLASNSLTNSTESGYSYLKFNPEAFIQNSGSVSDETIELPSAGMDYLKFNVNKFINTSKTSELTEDAASDLSYLKFDASKFAHSEEFTALPASDFNYLKFDASKFSISGDENSEEISGTPANGYNYLKFDATKFSTRDSANLDNTVEPGINN
ncbi:MAG: hypothetical protein WCR72_09370 [Bacteroidota bacterium]